MTKPIPVIYILSNGRSGTTLLDLLLGAHPDIWTLGEAQILPWELINPKNPCGDGKPVHESPFWREALPRIPTETTGYHIGYFRDRQQVGKVLRWNMLPDIWRGTVRRRWRSAMREYAANNAKYFEIVRETAQNRTGKNIKWLVDSSKDPYRLFWLKQSGLFDIRVVHLLKDPRAFVYSMTKDRVSRSGPRVVRYSGRWILENAIMAQLGRKFFGTQEFHRHTYEEFADRPLETLTTICNWLGMTYPADLVNTFHKYENFAISGNAMRWRARENEIRVDDRWKNNLRLPYNVITKAMTRPFLRYCGYAPLK